MAAIGSWNKAKPAGTDRIRDSDNTIRDNMSALETCLPQLADSSKGSGAIAWVFDGDVYAATKVASVLMPWAVTLIKAKAYADTAPTGAAIICDINKNGSSIFTTSDTLVTIDSASNAGSCTTPSTTAVSLGDRLSYDIDQVGSTTAGGNHLTITLYYNRA